MDPVVLSLGGSVLAVLCAAVARLWYDLKDEQKGRREDASAFTKTLREVQLEIRSDDRQEIGRLRTKIDSILEAEDSPRVNRKAPPGPRRLRP